MKNKQSEWAFGARQHKLRQTSGVDWGFFIFCSVWTNCKSLFFLKLISFIYYSLLMTGIKLFNEQMTFDIFYFEEENNNFSIKVSVVERRGCSPTHWRTECGLTREPLERLSAPGLYINTAGLTDHSGFFSVDGVQINFKHVGFWFKILLHKLMKFLQQEVNICYSDRIRLTKYIMLISHESVCQSLQQLKDKYTVVLTSYRHIITSHQKVNWDWDSIWAIWIWI